LSLGEKRLPVFFGPPLFFFLLFLLVEEGFFFFFSLFLPGKGEVECLRWRRCFLFFFFEGERCPPFFSLFSSPLSLSADRCRTVSITRLFERPSPPQKNPLQHCPLLNPVKHSFEPPPILFPPQPAIRPHVARPSPGPPPHPPPKRTKPLGSHCPLFPPYLVPSNENKPFGSHSFLFLPRMKVLALLLPPPLQTPLSQCQRRGKKKRRSIFFPSCDTHVFSFFPLFLSPLRDKTEQLVRARPPPFLSFGRCVLPFSPRSLTLCRVATPPFFSRFRASTRAPSPPFPPLSLRAHSHTSLDLDGLVLPS